MKIFEFPTLDLEPKCNFNDFYYFKNAFTDEMIEKTHSMIYNGRYPFSKGRTGYGDETDTERTNNRDIAYVPYQDDSKWIYEVLFEMVLEANDNLFQFDIDKVTDQLHYVIYPTDSGHLDWHMDIGYGNVNRRKLATTVQLSDPDDYEGGDFQCWYGGQNGFINFPREKGDVLIFPSFFMHRVTPIKSGERKALVFWTGSNKPFR
tara:strand:- start:2405 stop:3019 length:615 start_codon:yes stop_codon:yes gene_type:complete